VFSRKAHGKPHDQLAHADDPDDERAVGTEPLAHVRRRPATGDWVLTRSMSFRGDNDRAWNRAADFFLRQLAEVPVERR
jgi:1,2-phenylacetyl-CoA epoxidase PaaB subunit